MEPRPIPDWFDADRADFMQSAVSMSLASRNAGLRPSVTRGLGCRVSPDGEVRVYVDADVSQALLRDIDDSGHVAAVFSDVVRHRTLQVKASVARIAALDAEDERIAEAYASRFAAILVGAGYPAAVPAALLGATRRVAVVFRPHDGFEQTPGPQAGQRLEAAR